MANEVSKAGRMAGLWGRMSHGLMLDPALPVPREAQSWCGLPGRYQQMMPVEVVGSAAGS